jgi:uncharacterized protein
MKYLLVLLVVTVGLWLWRQGRRDGLRERDAARRTPPAPPPAVAAPQAMVRCARCGLHLPASDAVAGRSGAVYCSLADRRDAEG